jgi:TetR/AcrR family transcriptional regulator
LKQRPVDEVQTTLGKLNFEGLSPEEAKNPQRQMLWFHKASQNQGLYFKECNVLSLHEHLLEILEQGYGRRLFSSAQTLSSADLYLERLLILLHSA